MHKYTYLSKLVLQEYYGMNIASSLPSGHLVHLHKLTERWSPFVPTLGMYHMTIAKQHFLGCFEQDSFVNIKSTNSILATVQQCHIVS